MADRLHELGKDIALVLFSGPIELGIVVFLPIRGLDRSHILSYPLVALRDEVDMHLLADVVLAESFLHHLQRRNVIW